MKKLIANLYIRPLILAFALVKTVATAALEFETTLIEQTLTLDAKHYAFEFPFTHQGSEAIRITNISSTCGCTVAELEQRDYAPGVGGVIQGRFTVGNRTGRQVNRIRLQTDYLGQAEIVLEVRLDIPQIAAVQPGMLLWRVGEVIDEKSFTVIPNHKLGLILKSVAVENDLFSVETSTADPETGEVSVSVVPRSVESAARGVVKIELLDPDRELIRTRYAHLLVR